MTLVSQECPHWGSDSDTSMSDIPPIDYQEFSWNRKDSDLKNSDV